MPLEGEVTEAEWRETDRRRSFWIYLIGAISAAVVTALLYAF